MSFLSSMRSDKHKIIMLVVSFFFLVFCDVVLALDPPALNKAPANDPAYYKEIRSLWGQRKSTYIQWMEGSATNPQYLYNFEIETNNLLVYAGYCRDYYILNEIVEVCMLALGTLDETDQYSFYYYPMQERTTIHPLGKKYKMWLSEGSPLGQENKLDSSQFLYFIANAVKIIVNLDADKRSLAMGKFLAGYIPILISHYERWVLSTPGPFQVRGWGCRFDGKYVETGMNHRTFLQKKLDKTLGDATCSKYCNAVTDTDLWIIAGVAHLLASHKKNSTLVPLPPEVYKNLLEYVRLGSRLLESRVTYKTLSNLDGQSTQGANFDLGVWDDYPDYSYSGYTGSDYPKKITEQRGRGVGWDLSHARRFVHVFMALSEYVSDLGLVFPTVEQMGKFANQLVYGASNKDINKPKFTTYMDGTNGWYRVGYGGQAGYGQGPWDMSLSFLTGGYAFWMKYNNDIEKMCASVAALLNSEKPSDQEFVTETYAKHYWSNYVRLGTLNNERLIQWLPSLCFSKTAYRGIVDSALAPPLNLIIK